jgi:photosystem II stability/assembly factor-like uncharacterized protein
MFQMPRSFLIAALLFLLTGCTPPVSTTPSVSPSPSSAPSATVTASPTTSASASTAPGSSATPIPMPSFAQLSAPSGTVVWALVAGTRLFRSSARGDTWVERTIPPGLADVEVSFADETNGFLLSPGVPAGPCETQTASIWKTADGAASWQQVSATGIADAMCKRGLASSDPAHAFLTAYGPNSGPVIYRSVNGGPTWTGSKPLPDPPGFTFTKPGGVVILPGRPRTFGSIVLIEARLYDQQTRYVFRSTDGGATFAYASTAPIVEGTVAYVSEARWLQIASPSASKETTDGGATWHAFITDYSQAAPDTPDIVFGDPLVGYATVRGAIQRTVDGGVHWTTIKTPGT